ncbi:MAG: hypothetical protein EOO42_00880 [Flavobacteriales bacterium]|nr:MAG: hypothetical protein EOO42_00880 [Flavobacteriales bacterium]
MKNLKNLLPLFALVLGFALVFTQSAFKSNTAVRYKYKNNTSTNINQPSSWEVITSENEPTCDDSPELPCVVEVDGSLSTFLINHPTAQDIMDADEIRSTKSEL